MVSLKKSIVCFSILLLASCSNSDSKEITSKKEQLNSFQVLIDSASVNGSILILDNNKSTYYSNNYDWVKSSHLPASTFKIPNSLIALETGIVKNDSSLLLWNGEKHRFKIWEQDLSFRDAFHFSCVPCYQEIARKVGLTKMKAKLELFNFGEMVVDSNTLSNFWLEGQSRINQYQQIDFLKSFEESELPISKRSENIMKNMMLITKNDSIELRGKTGWSNENNINNGWFVGYVKRESNIYYFATNIEPVNGVPLSTFAKARKEITYKALNIVFN